MECARSERRHGRVGVSLVALVGNAGGFAEFGVEELTVRCLP